MSWTLSAGLEELSCGGLVVFGESSRDPDMAPFVGAVHLGKCLLILPHGGRGRLGFFTAMERDEAAATGLALLDPTVLEVERHRGGGGLSGAAWSSVLSRGLEHAGVGPTRLAVGGRLPAGISHVALATLERQGWEFVDGGPLLLRHRKRKTPELVDQARRAATGGCAAMRRAAAVLAAARVRGGELWWEGEKLSAARLRHEISLALAAHGLDQPEGNIVACGPVAGVPHSKGGNEQILAAGETIVIDLFPKGHLFADLTRTFVVGEAPAAVRKAHDLVSEVLRSAHRGARRGCRLWDLQQRACESFSRAGFPTPISHPGTTRGYVHGLGHGVGFELHEYPSFARDAGEAGILETGDLFTLEPGLYDADARYGVRLEDLCLAGDQGSENLTPLPYDWDPRRWTL